MTGATSRSGAATATRGNPADAEARFRSLVQSPLRAGLLRFLNAQATEAFEIDALMAAFGRLRGDVEHCLNELLAFGVARRLVGPTLRVIAERPVDPLLAQELDAFLERHAVISTEDQSPSVQRFRDMRTVQQRSRTRVQTPITSR